MATPIYVYYRLDNFYQNVRRYVISRDERQLRDLSISSPQSCIPLTAHGDLADHPSFALVNSAEKGKTLYPCGLMAATMFSDVLSACVVPSGSPTSCNVLTGDDWQKKGIAYTSDTNKFQFDPNYDPTVLTRTNSWLSSRNGTLAQVDDEDLIVWMRMAATNSFHKLYRQIKTTKLSKGDIVRITVQNNFDMTSYAGKKGIVLATQHFLGGKSFSLPIVMMVVGAACLLQAVFVLCLTRFVPGYDGSHK